MLSHIGTFHPQIVHFVIALLIAGVAFRLVSLTGMLRFTGPSATALLLAGTMAAILAVESGTQAHEAAESIPGARPAVQAHEEWGERTRNLFIGIAALELAALVIRKKEWQRAILIGSAVIGVVGVGFIYETGARGGDIVYSYAGGVGTRSGDTTDVGRLLLAGLYQQAELDRREHRPEAAADLFDELARRFGTGDPSIAILAAQSKLVDRRNAAAALTALRSVTISPDDHFARLRAGLLEAEAFVALQQPDSARAILQALLQAFPNNRRIEQQIQQLQ